jgi:hypothetical protein
MHTFYIHENKLEIPHIRIFIKIKIFSIFYTLQVTLYLHKISTNIVRYVQTIYL